MSKIKSALELAMEKTADIKVDPEKLRRNEAEQEARRFIGRILSGEKDASEWKSYFCSLDKGAGEAAKKASLEVLLANLVLPRGMVNPQMIPRIKEALYVLFPSEKDSITSLLDQCSEIFSQYSENREQVEQNLMDQVEQELRRKEAMLAQQGRPRHLTPQDDPEIMKMVTEQLQGFDDQFKQVLDDIKEQLKSLK